MSTRIVIVEDQIWQRSYVRQVCAQRLGLEVVGETGNGAEAIRMIEELRPDFALIDLRLEGMHGFAVVERLAVTRPQVRCVFMSVSATPQVLKRVERAQAWGFIDKNVRDEAALEQALQELLQGRRYFSPSYQACLRRQRHNPHACDKLLTNREREVLRLVGQARSDEEIAETMGLHWRTVQDHRLRVMRKLEIFSLMQLMRFAIAEGLTEFPDEPARQEMTKLS